MTLTDITLPEVRVYTQSAKFFRRGEQDFVEISFIGAKDTLVEKVAPVHMAQFRNEWDAYCDGRPAQRRDGIALTELPGLDEEKAESYFARNVHTLEELAALSDAQCQGIGHGTLTDRQGARKLVMQRQLERRDRMQRAVHEASAAIGPKPAEAFAAKSEIETVRSELAELRMMMADLSGSLPRSFPRKRESRKALGPRVRGDERKRGEAQPHQQETE
jgi:hypothetical protein